MTQQNMEQMVEEKLTKLSGAIDKLMAEREGAAGQDKEWRDKATEQLTALSAQVDAVKAAQAEASKRRIPGLEIGNQGEPEKFSVGRAVQVAVYASAPDTWNSSAKGEMRGINPLEHKAYGLEVEAMRQYAAQTGADNKSGGWAIPQQVMTDSIIPELAAEAMLTTAGASVRSGLIGEITWPKDLGGHEAYFTDFETFQVAAATKGEFGARKSTPKRLQSRTRLSWSMLTQTGGVMESYVREKLRLAITRRMDRTAFNGAGTENQVRGLYTTPGLNEVTFAGVVYQHADTFTPNTTIRGLLDEMHWKILGAEYTPGATAYIGQVNVGNTIAKRSQDANGRPMFVDPNGTQGGLPSLLGRPAYWTNIIGAQPPGTSNARFAYGDWSKLFFHFWEGMEIRAAELSYGQNDHDAMAGALTIFATVMADVFIEEPKAFTIATNFTADSL